MEKKLSFFLNFSRARLLGGESLVCIRESMMESFPQFEQPIEQSNFIAKIWPFRSKNFDLIWYREVSRCFDLALLRGAPMGELLGRLSAFVRTHEHWSKKLQALWQQFLLQLAIVLTLPWGLFFFFNEAPAFQILAEIESGGGLLFILLFSLGCQGLGILAFYGVFYRTKLKVFGGDWSQLRSFLMKIYCDLSCGLSLRRSLEEQMWDNGTHLEFHDLRVEQWWRETCQIINHFLTTGSPPAEVILGLIETLEMEREEEWNHAQGKLPTYLSLILCFFFVPAFFAILVGITWTQL